METTPFRCDSCDDADIALAIECDAAGCGVDATLERYAQAIPDLATLPIALDTAIECALHAIGGDPLAAAQQLIAAHADLADAILACALGLGIGRDAPSTLAVGALLFGRWRVVEIVGSGATATVARVRDEALSTPDAPVEAIIKRFDESLASEARAHAIREMRALLAVPAGLAPRPLALHASDAGSCILLTRFEPSRAAASTDDLARALDAVVELHRAGIAHGDLKPEHLRVREDGSVFLIDFGCAVRADAATGRAAFDADLARLAEMARLAARSWIDRTAARAACRSTARGSSRIARVAIAAASPRLRTRVAARGTVVAAVACALVTGGIAFGQWLASPPRISSEPYAIVEALSRTRRLREVQIGTDGRVQWIKLHLPELNLIQDGGPIPKFRYYKSIRFTPDGKVLPVPSDNQEEFLSRISLGDH